MKNQLQVIVRESGLEATKANYILIKFQDYFKIAAEWEQKAKTIKVTNADQKVEMQMARTGRLFLREKRIAIENARKELKEQALREGKAIDGIANVLKALIEPIEEYLEHQEKFVELKEQAKIEAEQIEKEKELEEKRKQKDKEKMQLENERLKREAEIREKKIKEEREKAKEDHLKQEEALKKQKAINEKAKLEADRIKKETEAKQKEIDTKLEKERKEKEKLETELKAKKDAEEKAKKEEKERIEAQKKASDKDKLLLLADNIAAIMLPEVKSVSAQKIIEKVNDQLKAAITIIKQNV
jgi:hypothetical protein